MIFLENDEMNKENNAVDEPKAEQPAEPHQATHHEAKREENHIKKTDHKAEKRHKVDKREKE